MRGWKCPLRSGRVKIGIPPTKVQYVWADKGGEMARGPVRQCANTVNQKSCNRWSLCQRLPPPHPLHSLPQHLHQTTPPCLLMTTRSSFLLSVTSSLVLIFKTASRFLVVNYLGLADGHFSSSPLHSTAFTFSNILLYKEIIEIVIKKNNLRFQWKYLLWSTLSSYKFFFTKYLSVNSAGNKTTYTWWIFNFDSILENFRKFILFQAKNYKNNCL